MPDYYNLLTAARWAGVNPWELARQPVLWERWILTVMAAEQKAQEK